MLLSSVNKEKLWVWCACKTSLNTECLDAILVSCLNVTAWLSGERVKTHTDRTEGVERADLKTSMRFFKLLYLYMYLTIFGHLGHLTFPLHLQRCFCASKQERAHFIDNKGRHSDTNPYGKVNISAIQFHKHNCSGDMRWGPASQPEVLLSQARSS